LNYIKLILIYQKIIKTCAQGLEVTSEMMIEIIKYELKTTEENNVN